MSQTNYLAAACRILIAVLFIYSGFSKIMSPEATQGYIAYVGMPLPLLAYLVAIVIELGGGILLLVGYQTRVVGLVIAVFTLATALIFHNKLADPDQAMQFLKNIAIAGGLLQVAAFGAGSLSLDARRLRTA